MLSNDMERYIKERYGDVNSRARNNALLSLKAMSRYEYAWGCDFTLQSYDVLQKAFEEISSTDLGYATQKLNELVAYANWRKQNGMLCGEGIYSVHVDVAASMKNEMVSSPEHLETLLNVVFDAPDKATFDVIYRAFLWLGFSGLTEEDAIYITRQDVDFVRREIKHKGSSYKMYGESFGAISMACLSNSLYESVTDCRGSRAKLFPRQESDYILRGKANKRQVSIDHQLSHTLRPNLAKKIKNALPSIIEGREDLPQRISYRKVYLSGIFFRLFLNEKLGEKPDFSGLAIEEIQKRKAEGRPYKTNSTFTETSIINRTNKKYKETYENWKKAFYEDCKLPTHDTPELTYEEASRQYEASIKKAIALNREAQNAVDEINNLENNHDYSNARKKLMEARAEHRKAKQAHSKLMELKGRREE